MSKIGLYVKFTTQTGQRDTLVSLLLEAASSMRTIADCELYIVNVSDTETDTVWVTEVWNNADAHQQSLTTEASKRLIESAKPLILGVQQTKLTPIGGKGLTLS
jgi:quinol monooxygenase YgiN